MVILYVPAVPAAGMPDNVAVPVPAVEKLTPLAGVYCEPRRETSKWVDCRGLEAAACITHVGYYGAVIPVRES